MQQNRHNLQGANRHNNASCRSGATAKIPRKGNDEHRRLRDDRIGFGVWNRYFKINKKIVDYQCSDKIKNTTFVLLRKTELCLKIYYKSR